MKPNDVIEVTCPDCNKSRPIKWSAYKSKKEGPPYYQRDRKCAGKHVTSEKTKNKISRSLTGRTLSPETKDKISEYRKAHPELWVTLQPELGRGKRFMPQSDETKEKIKKSMIEFNRKKKESESNE